jgi:hypothetical protein
MRAPVLALRAADEPSFRLRPLAAMGTYGVPPALVPYTLEFTASASRPRPHPKTVSLVNAGGGTLAKASVDVDPPDSKRWLTAETSGADEITVEADAAGLEPGVYSALVTIDSPGAANSPQAFGVVLRVADDGPADEVRIDVGDPGFYATPYFWVGHRLGHQTDSDADPRPFYLTNGGRAEPVEFVRYAPRLAAGRYELALADETPFEPGARFRCRVRSATGDETLEIEPDKSRRIGSFDFEAGTDGFVEVLAEGSAGLVAVGAVAFRPVTPGG